MDSGASFQHDDLYAVLGVPRDASETDIRSAYKKMALKWHPDKHAPGADREEAEKMFKRVAQAYEILSNSSSRAQYDRLGLDAALHPAAAAAAAANSAAEGYYHDDEEVGRDNEAFGRSRSRADDLRDAEFFFPMGDFTFFMPRRRRNRCGQSDSSNSAGAHQGSNATYHFRSHDVDDFFAPFFEFAFRDPFEVFQSVFDDAAFRRREDEDFFFPSIGGGGVTGMRSNVISWGGRGGGGGAIQGSSTQIEIRNGKKITHTTTFTTDPTTGERHERHEAYEEDLTTGKRTPLAVEDGKQHSNRRSQDLYLEEEGPERQLEGQPSAAAASSSPAVRVHRSPQVIRKAGHEDTPPGRRVDTQRENFEPHHTNNSSNHHDHHNSNRQYGSATNKSNANFFSPEANYVHPVNQEAASRNVVSSPKPLPPPGSRLAAPVTTQGLPPYQNAPMHTSRDEQRHLSRQEGSASAQSAEGRRSSTPRVATFAQPALVVPPSPPLLPVPHHRAPPTPSRSKQKDVSSSTCSCCTVM